MIHNRLLRRGIFAGMFTVFGCLAGASMVLATDNHHNGGGGGGDEERLPPQTLPQGFESTDDLLRDARRAEEGHEYSVWIVESSRFVGVPARSFMPDGVPPNNPDTVDLPVNIGIIKDRHGNITLYDSGWNQRDYQIMSGSCCNKDLTVQMAAVDRAGSEKGGPDRHRARSLGSRRPVERLSQCRPLRPEGGAQADRFLPELSGRVQRGAHSGRQHDYDDGTPELRAHPGVRLPAEDGERDPGQAHEREGEDCRRAAPDRARNDHSPGVPRAHLWIAAPPGEHEGRAARVRQRHVLVLVRDPRLAGGQYPADGHDPAVPRLREVLRPDVEVSGSENRLQQLHRGPRARSSTPGVPITSGWSNIPNSNCCPAAGSRLRTAATACSG